MFILVAKGQKGCHFIIFSKFPPPRSTTPGRTAKRTHVPWLPADRKSCWFLFDLHRKLTEWIPSRELTYLGKRKIIFKMPFLMGYVSSQKGYPKFTKWKHLRFSSLNSRVGRSSYSHFQPALLHGLKLSKEKVAAIQAVKREGWESQ